MRATVLVTSYNGGPYLTECVDSALAQQHEPLEVVVVDDGSTDGSPDVLRGYGDRIVAVLKKNGGQTTAINAGFAKATGDIVCIVDGDDVLDPDAIPRAVGLFADPDVVKVHWQLREIDDESRPTGPLWPPDPLPSGDQLQLLLDRGPEACAFPPMPGNCWRRSFLDEVFPLPEFERQVGVPSPSPDALLSMLAAGSGRIAAAGEPLGGYRRHEGNTFLGRGIAWQLNRYVDLTSLQYDVLVEHLKRRGIEGDAEHWKRESWYFRLHRVLGAIERAIPEGRPFVLVDEDRSTLRGDDRWPILPFLERDGEYWGPPGDDEAAIAELERLREAGTEAMVVTWLCEPWRDYYRRFFEDVDERYAKLLDEELVTIYDLTTLRAGPGAG